jgi:hypothetical protein
MRPELLSQTKNLLRALDHLLLHVFIYMVINLGLIIYVFRNVSARWWLLFIVVFWACILIYHGIRVYGKDPMDKNVKPNLLSAMMKLAGI